MLLQELSRIHIVFHVSMLRKYIADLSHALQPPAVELIEYLTYEEYLVVIVDRQVCRLRTKVILTVKVLWSNHTTEYCTWETEAMMRVA